MENNVDDSKLLTLKEVHISKEEFDQKYKIYKKHFEDSLENPEYTNIAITGDYGIGKSTIFKSFLKNNDKYKDKYIEVIIGNYYYKNPKDYLATTVLLEKQIINQLVSQVDSTKIPLSKYKLSFGEVSKKNIWISIAVTLSILLLIGIIIIFWDAYNLVGQWNSTRIFIIIFFISLIIGPLLLLKIKNIINYLHKIILKFKITNLEVEMEINKLSEFDNNLAELIYIFSNCEKNIFVFEDLDRFGNNLIFQKLRELNLIVNKYLQINDKHTSDKKISFVYLVKPDLFKKHDDFLKFFDISIPIIPIVNNFDSMVHFKKIFHKKHWENWNFKILVRSTHKLFNSVREIHNLHNEFVIYWEQNKDEYYSDEASILSFLILKNKFPETFKKLLNHQSELFQENANQPLLNIQIKNKILNKLTNLFSNISLQKNSLTKSENENKIFSYYIFFALWWHSPNDRKLNCTSCERSYNFYEFYNLCFYENKFVLNRRFHEINYKWKINENYFKYVYNENDFLELLKNQRTNFSSFLKYNSFNNIQKGKEEELSPSVEAWSKKQFNKYIKNLKIKFELLEYDMISLVFVISQIFNELKNDNLDELIKILFIDYAPMYETGFRPVIEDSTEYWDWLIKIFWLVDKEVKNRIIKEIFTQNWPILDFEDDISVAHIVDYIQSEWETINKWITKKKLLMI